jgi:hypothetical protein
MICNHLFVDGFGMMGDAVTCELCGLSKYPEAIPLALRVAKILGRYIPENHPQYQEHAELARIAFKRRYPEESS